MERIVEIAGHTLHLRLPAATVRIAWLLAWQQAQEGTEAAAVFAALDLAWDPAAGAPPWGALAGGILERGTAIGELAAGWPCGIIAVYNLADDVAAGFRRSLGPPSAAKVRDTADFLGAPGPGSSAITSSPENTSETPSSRTG